jgi:SAM-dependent methyltransferase
MIKHEIIIQGLKPSEDAFGNNIFDCYSSGNYFGGYEIEERDDGRFILYGDSNAYFEDFESWTTIQKELSQIIQGNILDVGCGGGKHALYFQSKGLNVFAMDSSPLAIDVCRHRGIRNTILCGVEHFSGIDKSLKFDSVLFFGNNLGLLQNEKFFIYFLSLLEAHTHHDSRLFFESMSPYGPGFDDVETVEYVNNNLIQKKPGGQMHVRVRYKKFATPWSDFLFLSADELKQLLTQTNWEVEMIKEDNHTHQYIAVVRRKG